VRHNRSVFDINGGEFLVIAVVALLIMGPERLPRYLAQMRAFVQGVATLVRDAQGVVKREVPDADLETFDIRQYDPRHMFREAMHDHDGARVSPDGGKPTVSSQMSADNPRDDSPDSRKSGTRYDSEAT